MGNYDGTSIHCVMCTSCKHYVFEKSSSLPHKCECRVASSSCAARSDNSGSNVTTQSACDYFEAKGAGNKKAEPRSKGKKPLWVKIICCPCWCVECLTGNKASSYLFR
jgi:hypothetical protein